MKDAIYCIKAIGFHLRRVVINIEGWLRLNALHRPLSPLYKEIASLKRPQTLHLLTDTSNASNGLVISRHYCITFLHFLSSAPSSSPSWRHGVMVIFNSRYQIDLNISTCFPTVLIFISIQTIITQFGNELLFQLSRSIGFSS